MVNDHPSYHSRKNDQRNNRPFSTTPYFFASAARYQCLYGGSRRRFRMPEFAKRRRTCPRTGLPVAAQRAETDAWRRRGRRFSGFLIMARRAMSSIIFSSAARRLPSVAGRASACLFPAASLSTALLFCASWRIASLAFPRPIFAQRALRALCKFFVPLRLTLALLREFRQQLPVEGERRAR